MCSSNKQKKTRPVAAAKYLPEPGIGIKIIGKGACMILWALLFFLGSGCDLDWKEKSENAYREALDLENQREFDRAFEAYQETLKYNP